MGDVSSFVSFVLGVVPGDELAADLLGPEVLGLAGGVVGDDRVGGVEDALGRPVVLLQDDHRPLRVDLFEPHEVAVVGTAELVDALIGVGNNGDVAMLLREHAYELPLRLVRVLELVDEHVVEPAAPVRERVGVLAEQPDREQQQIVEVGRRRLEEAALVLAVHVGQVPLRLGHRVRLCLLHRDEVVLHRRDRRVQLAGREALRVKVQVTPDVVDESDGVGLVVDRERRAVAELGRLAAQDAGAGRVEGRHPHAASDRPDEVGDPLLHLAGGLVGERDREQAERGDPAFGDQVRDPVGEDARLAGARAGHDEQRAVGCTRSFALDRVEAGEEIGGGLGHDAAQRTDGLSR